MGMVTLYIEGEKRQYDDKATYEVVAKDFDSKDNPICLVYEGKKLRELIKTVSDGAKISFVRKKDVAGHKTYVRTSILLTVKAAHDVLDKDINKQLKCEFAIADGYYFSPKNFKVDADFVTKLKKRMQELVDADDIHDVDLLDSYDFCVRNEESKCCQGSGTDCESLTHSCGRISDCIQGVCDLTDALF